MPTAAEIALALSGSTGASSIRFRYEQRTAANALLAAMTTAVRRCDIQMNSDRPIGRTARFEIDEPYLPATFTAPGSYIAVFMDVLVGGSYTAYQLGLFRADEPERLNSPNGREAWSLDGSDVTVELMRKTLAAPYTVTAGSNYVTTVQGIIAALGLPSNIPGTVDVTPIAFTWPQGTTQLKVVNDLLAGINFYPIWADGTGVLTSYSRSEPFTRSDDIVLHTEQEPRMIRPPLRRRQNYTRGPNQVVVKTEDPARAPVSGVRRNNDATSPISVASLGVTMAKEMTVDHIVDATRAAAFANYELWDACARAETATLLTMLDPRRGVHETMQLYIQGTEFGSRWQAYSWRLPCDTGGAMIFELGRVESVTLETPP